MPLYADDPDYQATEEELVKPLSGLSDALASGAASIPGMVVGGWRGLLGGLSGEGWDKANTELSSTRNKIDSTLTKPFQTPATADLGQKLSAGVSALNTSTPGRAIGSALDTASSAVGPELSTLAETGIKAAPYLVGAGEADRGVASLLERYGEGDGAVSSTVPRIAESQRGSVLPAGTTKKLAPRAIEAADRMQEAGATPEQIWGATGRQFGAPLLYDHHSGGWRAEISDKDFMLNPAFENGGKDFLRHKLDTGRWPTVGEAFSHPLLERIPELWDPISQMDVRAISGTGSAGHFQPPYMGVDPATERGHIGLHASLRDYPSLIHDDLFGYQHSPSLNEVGIHELQHGIDYFGGSPSHGTTRKIAGSKEAYMKDVSETMARANSDRLALSTAERVARPYTNSTDIPLSETTIPSKPSARPVDSLLDQYSIKPVTDRWGNQGYAVHNGDKPVSQVFKDPQHAQDELWAISEDLYNKATPTPRPQE